MDGASLVHGASLPGNGLCPPFSPPFAAMSSSKKVFLSVCLLLLLLVGVLFMMRPDLFAASKPGEGAAQAAPRPALAVTTVHPRWACLPERLPVDGSIVAWREAAIASESNSLMLVEVLVDVGDEVKKGQVLARFSPATVASSLSQARASLVEARAAAEEAEANVRRAVTVARTGALSQQQIDQYRATAKTARARVRSAQAALDARRHEWGNVEVRSPDDGVISARSATEGAVPGAGTELFRLIRQGRLEWQAEVAIDDVIRVRPGDEAVLHAPGGQTLSLRVRAVAPAATTDKRSALVYVDVPADANVRAGMYLGGELRIGKSAGLTVPVEALAPRDGFNFVYRLTPESRIERVRVQTARMLADAVEVKPVTGKAQAVPLDVRSVVVARGAGLLSEGDLVQVEKGPVPGAAAEAGAADVAPASGEPQAASVCDGA